MKPLLFFIFQIQFFIVIIHNIVNICADCGSNLAAYTALVIRLKSDRASMKPLLFFIFQIQFFIVIIHNIVNICADCDYPKWGSWVMMFFTIPHVILFSNFYYNAYIKRRQAAAVSRPQMTSLNGHAHSMTNGVIANSGVNVNGGVVNGGVQQQNGNLVHRQGRQHVE